MAAPRIIEDNGASLVVERPDGSTMVLPRATYESLYADNMGQAANHNAPSMEPASVPAPDPEAALANIKEAAGVIDNTSDSERARYEEYKRGASVAPGSPQPQEDPTSLAPMPEPVAAPPIAPELPGSPQYQGAQPFQIEDPTDYLGSQKQLYEEGRRINDESSRLQREDAKRELEIRNRELREVEEVDKLEAKKRAEISAETEARVAKIEQASQEFMDAKVDQGRWWSDKSTASTIGIGIAVAMTGIGMAMKGQGDKNPALDIIMKAINQDIELQLEAIDRKGKGVTMMNGALDRFMQVSNSKLEAITMTRDAAIRQAQIRTDISAAKKKGDSAQNGADILSRDLEVARVANLENYRARQEAELTAKYNSKTSRISSHASMMNARTARERLEMEEEEAKAKAAHKTDDSNWMVGVGGGKVDKDGRVLIDNPETRKAINQITGPTQRTLNSARRIRKLVLDHGKEGWGNVKEEVKLEAYNMAIAALEGVKGTPSEKDMVLYIGSMGIPVSSDGTVSAPNSWGNIEKSGTTATKMEKVVRNARESATNKLKALPGGEDWYFVEFNPIDLDEEERPPKSKAGANKVINDLNREKQEIEGGKAFQNTPEAKAKQKQRREDRAKDIDKVVDDVWAEVDAAYDTEVGVQEARRGIVVLGSILSKMNPGDDKYRLLQVEMVRLKQYTEDPFQRREKLKNKEDSERGELEKRQKYIEGLNKRQAKTKTKEEIIEENKRRRLRRLKRQAQGRFPIPENDPLPLP